MWAGALVCQVACRGGSLQPDLVACRASHTVYHGRAAYEDADGAERAGLRPGEHDTRNLFRLWLTIDSWGRTDLWEWGEQTLANGKPWSRYDDYAGAPYPERQTARL